MLCINDLMSMFDDMEDQGVETISVLIRNKKGVGISLTVQQPERVRGGGKA